MKTVIKHIASGVVFFGLLLGLLGVLSAVMEPKGNAAADGMQDPAANGILSEQENTIDTVFIGDSESYCAFVPLKIWQDYGITSYVCGTSGQPLYYSEEFLHKAFRNQSPKIVILETNVLFRDFGYTYKVKNLAEQAFSVFRYHNRWKTMTSHEMVKNINYTYLEGSKGFFFSSNIDPADASGYMKPTDKRKEIPAKNAAIVASMRDYCNENGAQLILVSTPSTKNWNYKRHNATEDLANELGLTYLDLNEMPDEIPIDWAVDTRDKGDHMNITGAVKVSRYMGRYLAETGLFTNKLNDPDYKEWDHLLGEFNRKTGNSLVPSSVANTR